jgi:hypothetical protein
MTTFTRHRAPADPKATKLCASEPCRNPITSPRSYARFCSSKCANREASRRYKARNLEKLRTYRREYMRDSPERKRKEVLRKYGLSIADYDAMLAAQGGKCLICGRPEWKTDNVKTRMLAVDHDHETGQVRGLLCGRCNTSIGQFDDDPELLIRAAEYLYQRRGGAF